MAGLDIIKGFKTIQEAVPIIGSIMVQIALWALVLGVIADIATNGSIGVVDAIATFLNGQFITDIVSALTSINAVTLVVISLITIVVLILVFKIKMGGKQSKGKSM